jgi:hypothetical protein
MKKASLRHTIAAIIGAVSVVGPQLLNVLGTWQSPKAALIASSVGFLVALCVSGKAVALLNIFIPESGTVQGATPASEAETPLLPETRAKL